MSLYQDRQIKGFLLFLTLFALLFVGTATVLTIYQVNDAEVLWLKHDEAVSSSLLEQGVPKEVVAVAFTNTDISDDGRSLLAAAGLGKQSESSMRPYFNQFQRSAFCTMLCTVLFFLFVLAIGIFIFFWKRKRLYQQADKILLNYINGDYSCHLPQNYEGAIYQVFSSIEQLATMLQSKNETERKAKEFLKDTISDISHQLKTPLAALTMYQEIIESEPENAETVKQFAAKMGISLKRITSTPSSIVTSFNCTHPLKALIFISFMFDGIFKDVNFDALNTPRPISLIPDGICKLSHKSPVNAPLSISTNESGKSILCKAANRKALSPIFCRELPNFTYAKL